MGAVEDRLAEAAKKFIEWEDQERAALFRELDAKYIVGVASCLTHDLEGPASNGFVFATCTKCWGRFKVRITPEGEE